MELCKLWLLRKGCQIFFHPSVVNSKKLIRSGSHVDVIGLALRTFLIHKQIYRVFLGFCLDQNVHDLEQRFTEHRRTVLRRMDAFWGVISGFIYTWINASKCSNGISMGKACHIPDFSH